MAGEKKRLKILVMSVAEPKTYGTEGKTLMNFQGLLEGEAKDVQFTIFTKALMDYIKGQVKETIDAEVNIQKKDTEQGVRWNRTVNQIYVDGKPLVQKSGYGGGASITIDTKPIADAIVQGEAIRAMAQLINTGAFIDTDGNAHDLINLEEAKKFVALISSLATVSPTPTPVTPKESEPQSKQSPQPEVEDNPETPEPIQNIGDLFTRCMKIGVDRNDVMKMAGVDNPLDITKERYQEIFDLVLTAVTGK